MNTSLWEISPLTWSGFTVASPASVGNYFSATDK